MLPNLTSPEHEPQAHVEHRPPRDCSHSNFELQNVDVACVWGTSKMVHVYKAHAKRWLEHTTNFFHVFYTHTYMHTWGVLYIIKYLGWYRMGHKHTGVHTCAVLSPSIFHISHSNIFTADLLRTAPQRYVSHRCRPVPFSTSPFLPVLLSPRLSCVLSHALRYPATASSLASAGIA